MKRSLYCNIVSSLERAERERRDVHETLCKLFPEVPEKTLGSITYQEYQKKMKRTFWIHNKPDRVASYFKKYLAKANSSSKAGFLLELSNKVDFSPTLMSRLILEQFYTRKNDGTAPSKKLIGQLLKDTSLIEDPILAVEIHLCTINDDNYGPFTDSIRLTAGLQHEEILKAELKKLKLDFVDEEILRANGYDKTPDVKLQLPIGIDGHVVNWIESKASFGDDDSHRGYLKKQYWSYWNRFGPGLVIYRSGYIDDLDIHRDHGIMLMDHLPTEITRMDPLSLI